MDALSIEVAESFKEALWKVEKDRDLEPMIQVLSEDCEVGNVAIPQTFQGHDGAREFWTSYRKTFDDMESTFRNVFADGEGHAALEWETEGTSDGDPVSYAGVSILEIEGDKVKRFMAYFDSSALSRQVVS
jgi:ketosteroid isomerase-like protein